MPSFAQVKAALMRCMEARPSPDKISLDPDASQLATVFAEMEYSRKSELPIEEFKEKQRVAYERWSVPS